LFSVRGVFGGARGCVRRKVVGEAGGAGSRARGIWCVVPKSVGGEVRSGRVAE